MMIVFVNKPINLAPIYGKTFKEIPVKITSSRRHLTSDQSQTC